MRNLTLFLTLTLSIMCVFGVKAQEGWQSAEKRANWQTNFLKEKLSLNESQVGKIKQANLKAEKTRNRYVDNKLAELSSKERSNIQGKINNKKNSIESKRDQQIKKVLDGEKSKKYQQVKSKMLNKTKQKVKNGDPQGGIELLY